MKDKRSIVIDGWYGIPNAGDEAILESISQMIREDFNNVEIISTTNNIEHTLQSHDVDDAIPRFRKRRPNLTWLQTVLEADELWIGGGGLFSNPGLLHYCQMIAAARLLQTRVVVVGVGASGFPPDDKYASLLVESLNLSDVIITRNKTSANALRSSGVIAPIFPLADLVFRYESTVELPSELKKIMTDNTIVVSVRDPPLDRSLNIPSLANALDRVADDNEVDFLFLPFNNNYKVSDSEVADKVSETMGSDTTVYDSALDYRNLYEVINKSQTVVGMRLHSMIFAAHARTPFVGIAYRPKCATLLNRLGKRVHWCDCINVEDLSEDVSNQLQHGLCVETVELIAQEEAKAHLISTVIEEHGTQTIPNGLLYNVALESVKDLTLGAKNKCL